MSAPFGKPISAVDIRISKPKLVAAIESSTEGNAAIAVEGLDQKAQLSKGLVSVCHELNLKEEVHGFYAFMSRQGKAHALMTELGNIYAVEVKSKAFKSIVRKAIKRKGGRLNRNQLAEMIEEIEADAFDNGVMLDVYYRVAPTDGGVEYDLGDAGHTRMQVTGGAVERVTEGSRVIFVRSNTMLETPCSDASGDLIVLRPFVNLSDKEWILYLGLISYYVAHPKTPGVEYPILAFISGQGTGKSFLSNMTQYLVDSNTVGLQTLPRRISDIIIAMNNTHLLCLDNLRYLSTQHTDLFCVSSTSGAIIVRALYTDGDMHVSFVQCPVLLNGIHDFNDQSDLAERMLVLHPQVIDAGQRQSKVRLQTEFETALPVIFKGLLDYIANILKVLPEVTPTTPARMYDFSHWFAAMEVVDGVQEGTYQELYTDNQKQAQLDSLLESPLAAVMVEFAEALSDEWKGEPMHLLIELNELVPISVKRSQDWPSNSIALTKRLKALQAGLGSQGIYVEFGRGKKRWTSVITKMINDQY